MTGILPLLLGLDFDGVLCDSALECFVSSWLAYHPKYEKEANISIRLDQKAAFFSLRPFIRSGEDYVLIQELLDHGREPAEQESFDREVDNAGSGKMRKYRERFYQGRENLLQSDREFWISLNRLYPHIEEPLKRLYMRDNIHIISTKRSDFIMEILNSRNIPFPINRIHFVDRSNKLELMEELLSVSRYERALFIDDQIDHLTGNTCDNLEVRLASWGYIKKSWLTNTEGIGVVRPIDMDQIFRRAEIG